MRRFTPSTTATPALVVGVVAVALGSAHSAAAGVITLVSGERLQGKLQAVADGRMTFTTRLGVTAVAVADVADYQSDGAVLLLELSSGERIVAADLQGDAERFQARTRFGALSATWSELAAASEADPPTATSPPDAQPVLNELTVSVGHLANQTSTLVGFQRTRLTDAQVSYTRALSPDVSASVSLPLYYSEGELTDFGITERDRKVGLGDLQLGLSRVVRSKGSWPHVQVRMTMGLPTGSAAGGPEDRSLAGFSSGKWSLGGHLGLQQDLGGGAVLASIGYTHYVPRRGGRSSGEVGWAVGYQVNGGEAWSLTSVVTGSVSRRDGEQTEPAYVVLSASFRAKDGLIVSPSFANGLNVDAQDFQVGLAVSRSW